jgi:hypothetical protein
MGDWVEYALAGEPRRAIAAGNVKLQTREAEFWERYAVVLRSEGVKEGLTIW